MGKISRKEILEKNYTELFDELGVSARSQTIIRRYAAGETAAQIARDFSIGPGSVRDVVQRFVDSSTEYTTQKTTAQNDDYLEKAEAANLSEIVYCIVRLFHEGHSFQEIAQGTSKSITAVRRAISKFTYTYKNFDSILKTKENHIRIGKYLKYLRESNGITIEEFSNRFLLTPKTVISYEAGHTASMPGTLGQDIAASYGLSFGQLWNPPDFENG